MVLVSACLLGENCKYSGGNNKSEAVLAYLADKPYTAVCPEVLGGLATPRLPSEIVGDRVLQKDGTDVTAFFKRGAEAVCKLALACGATEAVLKANSPSCGKGQIYDGTFSGVKTGGNGYTAEALLKMGIPVKTEQDLENTDSL